MKKVCLKVMLCFLLANFSQAKEPDLSRLDGDIKFEFIAQCNKEFKKQDIPLNIKSFCSCSYQSLKERIIETGIDYESDPKAIETITKDPVYLEKIKSCLYQNIQTTQQKK